MQKFIWRKQVSVIMKNECKKCGECCKGTMGPLVFPSDIEPICSFLKIPHENFYSLYCQKHILSLKSKEIRVFSIKRTEYGCVFLNDCLCNIYQVRPYQCRMAPYNFLSGNRLWKHMKCLDEIRLTNSDSSKWDREIFKELLEKEYQ